MVTLNGRITREPNKRKKTIRIGNHKCTGELEMHEVEENYMPERLENINENININACNCFRQKKRQRLPRL